MMEALEDHDDAQKVWGNLHVDENVEKALEAQSR